jgi:two-component system, chemotaxis family, CheB/CheR fusion protein
MLLNARRLEAVQLILLAIEDVTERRRDERELLSRELSHRVKNILAVVQALAMHTDDSSSVKGYRDNFIGRLSALARAHSLLLDTQWRGADLKQLVEQALHDYRNDRPNVLEIQGEPVQLSPAQGLGISLILHELATNATKYGAFARHEGSVRVSWEVEPSDEGRRVRLRWEEQGVPKSRSAGQARFRHAADRAGVQARVGR